MLQPRIPRTPLPSSSITIDTLATALNSITLCSKHASSSSRLALATNKIFVRHASHAAQGRANGPKDSAGRRLGAKKTASEYVIPGHIIFKQRGTKWFPGENVGIGKDHTIYATESGYVRYYRNPMIHPKRRYIGVAFERDGPMSKLPTPPNAPTRRRLGMYATPIKGSGNELGEKEWLESHLSSNSIGSDPSSSASDSAEPSLPTKPTAASSNPSSKFPKVYREGLTYRESNYSIGLEAERKGVKLREYDRNDRWLAWRKRALKVKEGMLARAAKATRKTKGKKSNKGAPPPGKGRR